MRNFDNFIDLERLKHSKEHLVPYIFSENYYAILMKRLEGKKLTYNEQYYYNHFIRKKLQGMAELMGIDVFTSGREFIRRDRLKKATALLQQYSRKHKGMKMLITGSFLYSQKYNDIDIFIFSKYNKEDYRKGKVHVNYLPSSVEKTLFFQSIRAISVSNFASEYGILEEFNSSDIIHLYEVVILLLLQKDDYIQELRDLLVRLEYVSSKVILNSLQLSTMTDNIMNSKNPIALINKYSVAKLVSAYKRGVLKKTLHTFIEKNSTPERGQKMYKNWKIYNQTYREALEVVA